MCFSANERQEMAYDYRGHRGHSYTSDHDGEQAYSQERQLYQDDFYEGNYQEEYIDSDYRVQESTPAKIHYTSSNQHSYQDNIIMQNVDHTRNTQEYGRRKEFIRKNVSHTNDYRDRTSRDDEQYHDQHNVYGNVPGAKYIEGGRRRHTSSREAQSVGHEMRGNGSNKSYQKRSSFKPKLSSVHSQSHNFRRHGIAYEHEHGHRHDKSVNRRDHTFDQEQGLMTSDNIYEYNHELNVTGQDREPHIIQDENVVITEPAYDESFCDFSDYSKERQHKSLPYKKIATSMESEGVVRNDSHSHQSSKQRKCLLSTPDIEPIKTGLLPTPVKSELDDTVLQSAETVPVYSMRDPTKLSTGLLPTPPDVHSTKMSTGLLPTPTVSPVEDEIYSSPGYISSPGLLPLPTYNPCDNSNYDKDVKPKIKPSKGLLPTPVTSVCSHPYIEGEEIDVSIPDNVEEFPLDNDVDSSNDKIQIESERTEIEMITDKQSTDSDANQKLQSTDIQIQLTKTLEGMQKTMEILKQKIKTESNVLDMNKKNSGNVKQGMENEHQNSTVVGENEIIVKKSSHIPINSSSEIEHECTEKISKNLDESECEVNETEPASEINENYHDSKSIIMPKAKNEHSGNVMIESKDIIQEHSKRKEIGPEQPREYRTYREWRLARERMNKYFYSNSSESEGNDYRKQGSGEGNYQRNQPSYKEKEKRKQEENLIENESNKVEDTKRENRMVNVSDNEKVMKNNEIRGEQITESEKFIYKTNECLSRQNSSDSLSSHYSKESLASGHDRSKSRDHDSDRSHEHSRNYHKEHSDRNKKIDKEHYHEKYHKHSHYNRHGSSSKDSKYSSSSKDGSSKESKHTYSSKDGKHSSTSKERKHSASSRDSKHSPSSNEHKHSSSFKNSKYSSNSKERKHLSGSKEGKYSSSSKSSSGCEQRSKHKDSYLDQSKKSDDSAKKMNNECAHFQTVEKGEINKYEKPNESRIETNSKINLFEKLAMDNEKHTQSKHNTNCKGNLFENLDLENETIDVVGEISTDEDNAKIKVDKLHIEPPESVVTLAYKEPSQKLNDSKCMKPAFVKLFDINKSKVKEMSKNTKESVKSRENIFDQMNGEISSGQNTHVPPVMNTDKEDASSRSNKSSGTVKPKLPISEDSSSDVDPFVKMSLFLNKEKKKAIQMNVLKNLKVLEKSAVFNDKISDCVGMPVSCSGAKTEYSVYRHDKQKKEFVKFLKRVGKTLYWKDIKLNVPRITLKRLDENDIKRLKYRLKTSKPEKIDFKQEENESIFQDEFAERTPISKGKYSSKIVENKNSKTYRRIIPVKYSSTEQSESSDLERIISQGERRAIIDDSDDNLEGSLGSEDSVCFDISDISDEENNIITSEQNMLEESTNVDSDLPIDPKSTSVEEYTSQNIGLKIDVPVESHDFQNVGITNEDSTAEINLFHQSLQENKESENQTMKLSVSKMSCSESAGKSLRRKNYTDSSDSSEDENHCQHGSSAKYQKIQSSKPCEKKTDNQNQSNEDKGSVNKETSAKDSVHRKLLPLHAKRLFKSSKQIKSNLSIMQMDGNADLIAGPPDDSSGEEGDVEDNVINIDSDDESSSSQDLFADLPERLLQMSPKPKQISDLTSISNSIAIKEEDNRNNFQVKNLNVNQESHRSSSETSGKTQDSGDDIMKNDDDKDIVIKDEPDWLKCYTQEPDTIFLSDDDEMIMSVSQPVILVSDDETQDPEADGQTEVKVKQEKLEFDLYGAQETTLEYAFENYSSAEDWSDKGSDFEPENMFRSLEKRTKTNLLSPERSMSDISLISEDDTLKSKTLPDDEKNSEYEKGGFDSSDGAVLSVNEDELLRSPNVDEDLMTKDRDILKESDEKKVKMYGDFCSSDDEILSRSALLIENQYMKDKKETILSNNENNGTTGEACSNEKMDPYMQETQVDPNIADEDTSNSVSLFDIQRHQFSDISDSDTKTVNDQTNQMFTSNQRNNMCQTLSDDSDFLIVDSPDDGYEFKTQSETVLLGDNGETHSEVLYEAQTQVIETDHGDSNEDVCESKADKVSVEDLYMAETQVDQPGPSSLCNDIPVKGKGSSQCLLLKSKQTSVNEIFEVETQVDEPRPSKEFLGLHDVELDSSSESFSGEDPQLQYYIPQKKQDNNLRNKRLSQNLGIGFESFSDDDNTYHAITEAISSPDSQDSDDLLVSIDATPRKQHIEIAMSDTSIGNDAHATHVPLKTVSKIGKENIEDQDLYNMATQIDRVDFMNSQESSNSSVIVISELDEEVENTDDQSADNDVCVEATQAYVEFDSDEQINNEDIFNMATQSDGCDNLKTDENSDDSISILSPSKDKGSRKVKQQRSIPDDDEYFIATKACMKDICKQDNDEDNEVNFYNIATQNNINDMERRDESIDEDFVTIPKYSSKIKHLEPPADEDVYSAATQAFVEEISDETEEDLFNIATQNDISIIKKKAMFKKCLNDTLVQTDTNKLSESDKEKRQLSRDIDKIDDSDDTYLQATQAYMDDDSEQQESDVDDIYNMATQKDDSDTNISSLSNNNKKESDELSRILDSSCDDDDAYLAATQADVEDVNDHADKQEEVDVFSIATQKNIYDLSSDENDMSEDNAVKVANEHKTKNKSSKSDSRCEEFTINFEDANDQAYYMETQCDELPDILPSDDVEEIDLLTYSSEDDVNTVPNVSEQTASCSHKENERSEKDKKSYLGTKSILKRPHAENISGRNVRFDVQSESSAAKKPRFILPERKTISVEPQPIKTSGERSASGLSHTFKPRQFFKAPNTGSKNSDIEVSDATKTDMWLSKKIPTKHFDKKGSKVKKRKRKSDEGDSLQARMMAAKSQLKERAMYTATHPDSIKRVKTARTATDLEDVALPSGSQIIDQGLPLLNSTGLLLKGNKSAAQSSEGPHLPVTTSASTAVLSIVTTTLSTANTSAVPTSVQSTPVNYSMHATVSTTEVTLKNLNISKDINKHVRSSQSKDDECRDKGSSESFRPSVQSVNEVDKGHKKSESITKQLSSHSKSHKHKRTEKERSSKSNADKENVSKSKYDNKDSGNKEGSVHERSKSGEKDRRNKHKRREKDNDKHIQKSGDYKKENKRYVDKQRHDSKKENKKYSGKERHDSGRKSEKEKCSKSKHSSNEKELNSKSKENNVESNGSRQVRNHSVENKTLVLSELSESLERDQLESTRVSTGLSVSKSTSSSTVSLNTSVGSGTSTGRSITTPSVINISTSAVSGISETMITTATSMVNFSTLVQSGSLISRSSTTPSVVNLSAALASGSSVSRSTARPSVVNVSTSLASGSSVSRSTARPSVVNVSTSLASGSSVSRSTARPSVVNVSTSLTSGSLVSRSTARPSVVNVSTSLASGSSVSRSTAKPSVVNVSTSLASGSSISRSTARPQSTVRPSVSTHIQSAVLLQKQSSHPPTSVSTNEGPPIVAPCRQPLQPLQPDNTYNTFNTVSNLKWESFLKVILKWSPNWFEERERMEQTDRRAPPPDVTNDFCGHSNHMLFPLIGKYVSFKEYSEKFMLPLLLHETWESCYSTWRERKGRGKLINLKMMFSHQSQGGDKLMVYTLIGLISEGDIGAGNCVNEGDLVKLTINGDMKVDNKNKRNLDYTMSGFIDKVIYRDFSVDRICAHYKQMGDVRKGLRNCISLKLNVRVRARSFIPSDKTIIHLQSISTIMNTLRQFTGLSYIPRSPLCRDLLYPTANMTYCDKAPASVSTDRYNESQSVAINTAGKIVMLPKEMPRICLLQGPPGTGKSHTIVGIIKHVVKVMRGHCRICLTAPSHAAVDELLRRLNKYNRNIEKNAQLKLVRLGKKSSVHEDIHSLCLDDLVKKNLLQAQKEELLKQLPKSLLEERKALENKIIAVRKKIDTAKDQFQRQKHRSDLKKLEKQKEVLESKYVLPKTHIDRQQERQAQCNILLRAHVIAGTLSRIGGGELRSAFHNITGPAFDVVIVDEATQAIELETLIPLQYGVTKLILVGDPEQLPPTVLSQKATENQFNMSLFERLDGHFKGENINPVILLNRQYRMDPEIAAFPNKYIYDGKILNDKCVVNRNQLPLVPYLLFNVSEGRELFSQGTRSMSNPLEAIFTAELCIFIITNSSVIEKVIGIIAPYAKQKTEIVKELEKRHLKNIEVSTVDGFQGREKHVIIMSCVRANQSGTVGFVGDRKRMNVSLTRAKYAMYLVGHFESLEVSDEWKPLLADARQRQKIISVNQYSMKDAIKKILRK